MACETVQKEKPAGIESDGPSDSVHGGEPGNVWSSRGTKFTRHEEYPGNGDINYLDHIARLDPSATGYLVNSKPKEIYDG